MRLSGKILKGKLEFCFCGQFNIGRPMLPLTPLGKVKKLDLINEMKQEFGKK